MHPFKKIFEGTSHELRPIPAYVLERSAGSNLYLLAGVHGDEIEGMNLLDSLWKNLCGPYLAGQQIFSTLIVIPCLNPDGKMVSTRVNARGVDLNRNLPSSQWQKEFTEAKYNPGHAPLSEPENQTLLEIFKIYPPKFIVSFHSWRPMLNWNGKCEPEAKFLHQFNKYPVVGDIEDYPTPGSLGEYGPQKHQCPVLTFECPLYSQGASAQSITNENLEGLLQLVRLWPNF